MTYKFALITGATSGIGEAFARALPPETALFLTGRDRDRLRALAAELGRDARQVATLAADLATDQGRDALVAEASRLPLDLLINNAGLGHLGRFQENPPEIERTMAEVNVITPLVLTRALLPNMIARARKSKSRAGVIVVASSVAFQPIPYMSTYAATKAFDLFFAEGLAGELKREPVDVLALCPGGTATNFFTRAGMDAVKIPALADPDRVAREALVALGKRSILVVGANNRAFVALTRLLPRRVMRNGAGSFMRRGLKRSRRT